MRTHGQPRARAHSRRLRHPAHQRRGGRGARRIARRMMLDGARYLVRFDDICPGMNWPVWREIEKILADTGVKPMLAVVPSNEDAHLDVGPREPRFWEHVRG